MYGIIYLHLGSFGGKCRQIIPYMDAMAKKIHTNKHLAKHHGTCSSQIWHFAEKCWNPFLMVNKNHPGWNIVKFDHPPKDQGTHQTWTIRPRKWSLQKNINNHFLHEEASTHALKKKRNRDIQLISTGQCSAWHSNWQLACTDSFLISDNAFVSQCNFPWWFVSFSTSSQILNVWTFTILWLPLYRKLKTNFLESQVPYF